MAELITPDISGVYSAAMQAGPVSTFGSILGPMVLSAAEAFTSQWRAYEGARASGEHVGSLLGDPEMGRMLGDYGRSMVASGADPMAVQKTLFEYGMQQQAFRERAQLAEMEFKHRREMAGLTIDAQAERDKRLYPQGRTTGRGSSTPIFTKGPDGEWNINTAEDLPQQGATPLSGDLFRNYEGVGPDPILDGDVLSDDPGSIYVPNDEETADRTTAPPKKPDSIGYDLLYAPSLGVEFKAEANSEVAPAPNLSSEAKVGAPGPIMSIEKPATPPKEEKKPSDGTQNWIPDPNAAIDPTSLVRRRTDTAPMTGPLFNAANSPLAPGAVERMVGETDPALVKPPDPPPNRTPEYNAALAKNREIEATLRPKLQARLATWVKQQEASGKPFRLDAEKVIQQALRAEGWRPEQDILDEFTKRSAFEQQQYENAVKRRTVEFGLQTAEVQRQIAGVKLAFQMDEADATRVRQAIKLLGDSNTVQNTEQATAVLQALGINPGVDPARLMKHPMPPEVIQKFVDRTGMTEGAKEFFRTVLPDMPIAKAAPILLNAIRTRKLEDFERIQQDVKLALDELRPGATRAGASEKDIPSAAQQMMSNLNEIEVALSGVEGGAIAALAEDFGALPSDKARPNSLEDGAKRLDAKFGENPLDTLLAPIEDASADDPKTAPLIHPREFKPDVLRKERLKKMQAVKRTVGQAKNSFDNLTDMMALAVSKAVTPEVFPDYQTRREAAAKWVSRNVSFQLLQMGRTVLAVSGGRLRGERNGVRVFSGAPESLRNPKVLERAVVDYVLAKAISQYDAPPSSKPTPQTKTDDDDAPYSDADYNDAAYNDSQFR